MSGCLSAQISYQSIENGHNHEENQVSNASESCSNSVSFQ